MLEIIIKDMDFIMAMIIGIIYLVSFIYYIYKIKDINKAFNKASTITSACALVGFFLKGAFRLCTIY